MNWFQKKIRLISKVTFSVCNWRYTAPGNVFWSIIDAIQLYYTWWSSRKKSIDWHNNGARKENNEGNFIFLFEFIKCEYVMNCNSL